MKRAMKWMVVSLIVLVLLTAPASATTISRVATAIPLWKVSDSAGAAWIVNEKYVIVCPTTIIRNPISYLQSQNIFVTIAPVKVMDIKTGNLLDSLNPAGHIIAFRIDDNGHIHKVVDIPAAANPYREAVLALPTGIVYATTAQITLYSYDGVVLKRYTATELARYAVNVTNSTIATAPYIDDVIQSPKGYYISLSGKFINSKYIGGGVFILNDELNILHFIPATSTQINDADIHIFVGRGTCNYIVYACNSGGNNITVIDMRTGSVVWHGKGTPVSELKPPVYACGVASEDGKYIFLLKQVNYLTNAARLEIWRFADGSLSLVETKNFSLHFPTETTQPRTAAGIVPLGNLEYITFPAGIVIYNKTAGSYTLYGFNGSYSGRLAAISPQARYAVMGDKVYALVTQDIQAGNPRIRFIGDLVYNPSENHPWELNSAFVLSAPKNKPYHIYFQSGSLKITYVESGKRPVILTKNPAIRDGLLGKMYDMGLIKSAVLYTNGASVEDMSLKPVGDREIIFNRTHVFHNLVYGRIIGTAPSVADSGVVIQVPVDTDVSPYANLTINPKFSVAVVVPQFNLLHELIGVSSLEIASSGAGFATAKLLTTEWLKNQLAKIGADILAIQDAEGLLSRVVVKVGSRACFIIGVGLAIDTAVGTYTHYENLKKYEHIQTIVCTVPIFKDTKTGDVYAAVNVYLPSTAKEQQAKMYRSHIVAYLEKTGIPASHISVRITYIPGSWQHYMTLIKDGQIRKANLLDLAGTIPVPTSRLKITKIDIIISTVTEGYASLFDILKGGYKEAVGTMIVGDSIEVSGVVSSFHTRDPEKIVTLIPKVEINGRMYNLVPSVGGAIANFALPLGAKTLVIRFPNSSYLRAVFRLDTQVLVKQDMVKKKGYYEANFHFDWKYGKNDLVLLTKRIEFVDMPYKMVYAERRIKVRNGKVLATNIGKYFELKSATKDPTSPTGVRYYYVTEHPEFLDPTEGAKMETCKRYDFRYWYVTPPKPYPAKPNETYPLNGTSPLPTNYTSSIGDAWVRLYLNGTTNTSTIPRMLVVWLGSTGTQKNAIKVRINERAGYLSKNDTPVYTMNKTFNLTKTLEPNSSCVQLYDIQKFIAEAIRHAPRGFFEASATIVQATYNNVMSDDYDRITYFPSPKLPPTGSVVALNVRVVNAANLTPISSAYVYLDNHLFGTTNLAGWANETTTTGYHTIRVIKDGYREYDSDLNVFDNMSVNIYMIPNNFPLSDYRTLETLVVYNDGAPFPNAQVTVTDHNTGAILFNQTTDSLGIAKFLIPVGKVVDVHIVAGNATFNFTGVTMNEDKRVVATLTTNSNYFAPDVGITNVSLITHWGMGWYYGSTQQYVRTVVFSNIPQTITLHYRAFDVNTNQTLNESDLTVKVHRGINYIMHWVSLNVRNQSRDVAVEVSIAKYEQDSDPANNVMMSNTVLIKPFVDLSVTVLWKPVKQKTPLAILPGDLIEVDVGFMIPCRLSGINASVSINAHDLSASGFRMKPIEKYSNKISSYKPNTTVWYNTTVVVPFTDEIVVNASISHPWEYMGWNNYANTTIPVFPDTAVMGVSIPSLLVQSGQKTDVTVNIKSNAIGRGATVSVVDENTNTSLGVAYITITKPNMTVTIHANVPKIASIHTQSFNPASINISGMYEMHTWNISVATVDYYPQNDYTTVNVRIWAIPWWVWATGTLIVVLLVLVIVLKVVAILRTKSAPKYKYFKKLEGEEEIVSKDVMKVGKSEKKFRFFKRLK